MTWIRGKVLKRCGLINHPEMKSNKSDIYEKTKSDRDKTTLFQGGCAH